MLWVVLPAAIPAAVSTTLSVHAIAIAALNIRVAVEIIVVVDGDVVVAAPAAVVAPPPGPHRAHGHPNTKRNSHTCRVIARRWVCDGGVRIWRRSIDDGGVIARNVNNLRIGLFDHDNGLALDDLRFYLYLLIRL